jgi:DNA repair protein RadC
MTPDETPEPGEVRSPPPPRDGPPSRRRRLPAPASAPPRRASEAVAERPLLVGPERLSTPDLVAILIGRPGREPEAARSAWRLLDRFRTLRRLSAATPGEIASAGRLPRATATRLAAAFSVGRRAAQQRLPARAPFRTSGDIFDRYHPLLRDAKKERFLVVLLDAKNRVMRDDQVSEGHLTSAPVHPREVFGVAMRESASALVCVHNHPSGDPSSSGSGSSITS